MDEARFDTWTTEFAATRRRALRLVAGSALGAALLRLGLSDAAAACKHPKQFCDKKKDKCCGGAQCKGGRCRCKNAVGCGPKCCQAGQVCVKGIGCQNGPRQPGEICNPKKPLGCQSGKCRCITLDDVTQCTCREEACLGFGIECSATSQCCQGFCSEFNDPPTCEPLG